MKKLTIVLFSCLFTGSLISQSNELELLIFDKMENYHIPGLAAAIVTPSGICWEGYFGMANFEEDRPVDTSTTFILASVAKTITATAVLKLHQEGYFELDDDINSHLPFDVHIPNYPETPISFRQLLTHTSSINDNWDLMWPYCTGDCPTSLYDYLFNYLNPDGENYYPELNFNSQPPGSTYDYCNIGFALLGLLVEEISETAFNEYCNLVLFDEMEMDNSRWFLSETDASMLAMPYEEYNTNTESYEALGHYGYADYPSGQLRSNTHDLANFLLTYIQGGWYNDEISILDPNIVQLLTPSDFSDGLTWFLESTGGYNMWGHSGADSGVRTNFGFNPQDSTGVILLTNGESNIFSSGLWGLIKAFAHENCVNVVSTAEIERLSRVEIFPNPNKGLVNIDLGSLSDVAIKVLNVRGQLIYSKENINTPIYQFELDAKPGVYIIELSAKSERQQFKIIKSK